MIPFEIKTEIEQAIGEKITNAKQQSGGDINKAAIIETDSSRELFIKWNELAPINMFETEARGLSLLQKAGSKLVIPSVLAKGDKFLVLNLIEREVETREKAFNFGQELATIHQFTNTLFGLDHDNYIGKLQQKNNRMATWSEFYITQRIEPQLKLGVDNGAFSTSLRSALQVLYKVVEEEIPVEKPALLHGDLWSGNYMYTKEGGSIYDPAVYFGHREMDIAMTKLFGGFSALFYDGYNSIYPLQSGFDSRQQLCNLYPLLVHANLFGGSYIDTCQRIITHYTQA